MTSLLNLRLPVRNRFLKIILDSLPSYPIQGRKVNGNIKYEMHIWFLH